MADRKRRGAWYTPRSVVEGLVELAVVDGPPALVIDWTCGGGAFLLAALDRLVALGVEPVAAIGRVAGMDLDADAVEVTRWSIERWLAGHGVLGAALAADIDLRVGDALVDGPVEWAREPALVVGNPPFASPLRAGAIPTAAVAYREERSDLLGPYADLAAMHLLRAVEQAPAGSTVALVQPQSTLSGRDTEGLRSHLDTVAVMTALWAARESVFDAGVRACAPVLNVTPIGAWHRSGDRPVKLAAGRSVVGVARTGRRSPAWGELAADALGAPILPPMSDGRLGELVTATAGFRDEHYGLAEACREARVEEVIGPGTARLVTVGSLDPLTLSWGREPHRFAGRSWTRPVVDREMLSAKIAGWFDRQRRPKVLLATQTKLLEPVVDRAGDIVPATPLVAVHTDADQLDRVAAVLLAPPVVAWAWRRWFGTALSVDAVKLAARQVGELPLPFDGEAWADAAALVASADGAAPDRAWEIAVEVATAMNDAYRAPPEVLAWWTARLKPSPPAGAV